VVGPLLWVENGWRNFLGFFLFSVGEPNGLKEFLLLFCLEISLGCSSYSLTHNGRMWIFLSFSSLVFRLSYRSGCFSSGFGAFLERLWKILGCSCLPGRVRVTRFGSGSCLVP